MGKQLGQLMVKEYWPYVAKTLDQHPDREQESIVISMNPDGSDRKMLVSENGKSFSGIEPSPDGKLLAMTMNTPNLLSFGQLVIANADGTNRQVVEFDRVPGNMKWTSDNKYLYFSASSTVVFLFSEWMLKLVKLNV